MLKVSAIRCRFLSYLCLKSVLVNSTCKHGLYEHVIANAPKSTIAILPRLLNSSVPVSVVKVKGMRATTRIPLLPGCFVSWARPECLYPKCDSWSKNCDCACSAVGEIIVSVSTRMSGSTSKMYGKIVFVLILLVRLLTLSVAILRVHPLVWALVVMMIFVVGGVLVVDCSRSLGKYLFVYDFFQISVLVARSEVLGCVCASVRVNFVPSFDQYASLPSAYSVFAGRSRPLHIHMYFPNGLVALPSLLMNIVVCVLTMMVWVFVSLLNLVVSGRIGTRMAYPCILFWFSSSDSSLNVLAISPRGGAPTWSVCFMLVGME